MLRKDSRTHLCRLLGIVIGLSLLSGCSGCSGGGSSQPTAVQSNVSLSVMSLMFPQVGAGTSSSPQSVTLSNTGNASLGISSIAITGTNAVDFAQTNTCGSSVGAEDSCTISITFTPTADGIRTASVTITDNASGSPQTVSLTGTGTGQYMTLSASGTYLVNTITNQPVFITGDTAFSLSVQLSSNADIETYLSDRQTKGINLIWVTLVDADFHLNGKTENDASGNNPWNGGADFTGMSGATAYWSHVDYVLQRAAAHGITVLAGTAFTGTFDSCSAPYYGSMASASDATMTAYGQFLGNRYQSYPNIIWLLGGDASYTLCSPGIATKLNDIATGIRSADPVHLMTIEATGSTWGEPSALNWSAYITTPSNPNGWITLGTIYPKGIPSNTFSLEISQIVSQNVTETSSSPFVPYFNVEDPYETEPGGAPYNNQQLRQEGYSEVLGGAYLGRLFGSSAIWPFNATCCEPSGYTWQTDIDATPSADQQRLGQLFRSREHWKMVPDVNHTVAMGGYGTGSTLTVASRTSDGQTIIAYIPNGSAATILVDMSQITSSSQTARCWWFNPSSGAASLINTFATSGLRSFTPPDSNDWVLVIDDAGAGLPAPGSADLRE